MTLTDFMEAWNRERGQVFLYRFRAHRSPREDYIPNVQVIDLWASSYREAAERAERMVGPEFTVVRLPV